MDYDDNDFHSQNFQLAGEENTKFPLGLRSFALPKFDLDDNLQAHLRFDSLVETEVLLGIQNQEATQWIEEFSCGSSGIEFSSSAAKSCSISRHNNVWSEATSSESVEMLLKSVGQDEMIKGQTVVEDSDAFGELGSLTNQIEPGLDQGCSIPSKFGDTVVAHSALAPHSYPDSFSELCKDSGVILPGVKAMSQTHEAEKFGQETSRDVDPKFVSEKNGLRLTEGNQLIDEKSSNESQMKGNTLVNESLDRRTPDSSGTSTMQVDYVAKPVENTNVSDGELNDVDNPQQITDTSYGTTDGLLKNDYKKSGKDQVVSKEAETNDQNCEKIVIGMSDGIMENSFRLPVNGNAATPVPAENATESSICNAERHLSLEKEEDSKVQMAEVCSNDVCSENPVLVTNKVAETSKDGEEQSIGTTHAASLMVEGTCIFEGHDVEVTNRRNCTSSEVKINSQVQMGHKQRSIALEKPEEALESGSHQLKSGLSVNTAETSILSLEDNKISDSLCEKSNNSHAGTVSGLTVELCSPADRLPETKLTENLKGACDGLQVHGEDISAQDHILSSFQSKSSHVCRNIIIEPSSVHNIQSEVSGPEKENVNIITDSVNMDCDIDHALVTEKRLGVASSSAVQSTKETEVIGHVASDHIVGDESAPAVDVVDANFASCDEAVSVNHIPSGNVVATDEVIEQKEDEKLSLSAKNQSFSDKKEETVIKTSVEPNSPALKDCSEQASESVPGNNFEGGALHDDAGELIGCMVSPSSSSLDTNSITCHDEPKPVVANKATEEPSGELIVSYVSPVSTVRENDATEMLGVSQEKSEASLDIAGMKTLDEAVPSSLGESSHVTDCKDQEDNESVLASVGNNTGESTTACTGGTSDEHEDSTRPAILSEHNVEFSALEDGKSPHSDELNCGSPIVIPCSKSSICEKENWEGGQGSLEHNDQVSGDRDVVANKVESVSQDPKGTDASEDDRSFTFEVSSLSDLSGRETGKGWKPFSSIQPFKFPQTVEGSPSTITSLCQRESKRLPEVANANTQDSDGKNVHGKSKGNTEQKTRRQSGKATEKGSLKEGKPLKEITMAQKKAERGGKSCSVSPGSLQTVSQVLQAKEMQLYAYVEGSSTKSCGVPTVQASNLPDLNSSASPSTPIQQPFTDLQQVQLRAQIFVYGSLIQGTPPDEACMISAFGESDGGRGVWERVWRAAIQRHYNERSTLNPDTPMLFNSGVAGSKVTPSAIVNPAMPLSSPLWSISTHDGISSMPRVPLPDSHQALSSLHPYQSPHLRNYMGHGNSWLSQASSPGPWVVASQVSAIDAGAHYSTLPTTEAVNVISVREPSVQRSSSMQNIPTSPLIHGGASTSVFPGTAPQLEPKRSAISTGKQPSNESKHRKRKKNSASEELVQSNSHAKAQSEAVPGCGVTSLPSTSVAITTPALCVSKTSTFVSTTSSAPSINYQIIGARDTKQQRVILTEETCSKIEQAKLQAEDAVSLAASAANYSEGIWNQLANQKDSGLASEIDVKLASAAVGVAAAASVAKAAAAAAKVASDAALQAKLMLDEALVSSRTGEAARRLDDGALAAIKRAQNLDAVVKAAEMAAVAISQAGAVVAMGDPIPLTVSELVEAGPDGFWKKSQVSSENVIQLDNTYRGDKTTFNSEEEGISHKYINEGLSKKKEMRSTWRGEPASLKELPAQSVENQIGLVHGMQSDSVRSIEKVLSGQKGRKVSDLAKTIGVVPESEIGLRSASITVQTEYDRHQPVGTLKENSIMEGSLVEVLPNEDGHRKIWFLAKVLSLKDGKAYICYSEPSDEGSRQQGEWVELKGDGDEPPRIRIAHPTSALKFSGTRKRRRAAMGEHTFSVGDRVDAWMRDGWWEGVITDKSNDETILTVQLTAQEDKSVFRAWDLRPSLIWRDGQWVEWSPLRESSSYPHEGDAPQEKRLKLVSQVAETDPAVGTKGKDKIIKNAVTESGKSEEPTLLELSAKKKVFNVGKNVRDENKPDSLRTKRSGLQMEGSKVIFGVPKPGKKQKFMEVSKHYVTDKMGKINNGNDSVKFTKYLIPQGSGCRGWKNNSNVDSKGKQATGHESKVLRSAKPQTAPTRSTPKMDSSSNYVVSTSNNVTDQGHSSITKPSVNNDENISEKQSIIDVGSFPDAHKSAKVSAAFSSVSLPPDAPSMKKSALVADHMNKGKLSASDEKLARTEENDTIHNDNPGNSIPNIDHPRRSNRRIQPTSRLLEGLQSSMIISKIPAVSHDKGSKGQHRTTSSSRGNSHS